MKASELRKALSLVNRLKELTQFLIPFRMGVGYAGDPDPNSGDPYANGNYVEFHVNGKGIQLGCVTDEDVRAIVNIVEKHHAAQLERVKAAGIEDDTA